jgi:hypothetical protein
MTRGARFRLNSPQAIAETVDGEAVVVNLGTGTYYSMKGDSLLVWEAIAGGGAIDEIAAHAAELSGDSEESAAAALERFCESLVNEGLIIERDGDEPAQAVDLTGGGPGLLDPRFEMYTDMQDLILLDPVHEVDERGWPHTQPAA